MNLCSRRRNSADLWSLRVVEVGAGLRRSVFRCGDLLFIVHGKKQVVFKPVQAVGAAANPVIVNLGGLRKPHVQSLGLEVNRSIFNGGSVSH